MRCRQAERFVSARLDGELSPRRMRCLLEHLADCPRCRRFAQDLSACDGRLAALATWEPRPGFTARFRARLKHTETRQMPPRRRVAWLVPFQVAAAAAALFVGSRLAGSLENDRGIGITPAQTTATDPADTLYNESLDVTPSDPLDGIDLAMLNESEN